MARDKDEDIEGDADAKDEFVPVEKPAEPPVEGREPARDRDEDGDGDVQERRSEARLGDDREDGDDRRRPRRQRTDESDDDYRDRRRRERREYRQRSKGEVARLRGEVDELRGLLMQTGRNTETSQIALIDGKIEQVRQAYNSAAAKLAEATSGADGVAAVRAAEAMQQARDDFNALTGAKRAAEQHRDRRAAEARQPKAPELSRRAMRLRDEWFDRNDWFDPDGGDQDNDIVLTVDSRLTQEGYDPGTREYWDELDDRLEDMGIGRRGRGRDDGDRPRPRPPVRGGRDGHERGRRVEVTLSRERREALEAAGYDLSNPKQMQSILKRYRDFDTEHGLNGRGRR